MTSERRLERDLPMILGDLAMGPYPEYIDDVLATTAQRRQRPAWTFPERWLSMDLVTTRVPTARIPFRALGVLVLIALLVAAALAIYVGSQPARLPAPFGLAANGHVAYAADGDIYTVDPKSGVATPVVTGPETDLAPVWSRDGTHFVFERKVEAKSFGLLFVAREDGRGLVQVTPEPLFGLAGWSFSPDGRSIVALVRGDKGPAILVAASDGTGQPMFFEVGATSDDTAPQYRPDGSEIMFIGRPPGSATRGIYALDPASGKVRTVIAASATEDIHGAAWSPDGTRIAYGIFDPSKNTVTSRTHVVSADGTGDIAVNTDPDSFADGGFEWSNDGTRLIIGRAYMVDGSEIVRSAIVPIDRSSAGVEIECPPDAPANDCTAGWIWSPDDSVLLGARSDASNQPLPQILADPFTGDIRSAPWTATGDPAWQRRAP